MKKNIESAVQQASQDETAFELFLIGETLRELADGIDVIKESLRAGEPPDFEKWQDILETLERKHGNLRDFYDALPVECDGCGILTKCEDCDCATCSEGAIYLCKECRSNIAQVPCVFCRERGEGVGESQEVPDEHHV